MKCSSCGKEFGDGANCQSCGIDRFVGLGEYNGFRVPKLKEDKVTPNDNSSPNDSTIEVNGCNSVPFDNQSEKGLFKESDGDRKSSSQLEQNKLCPFCQEVIPTDAIYCPFCSKRLEEECPSCGHRYSAKYPACPKCGTNRKQFFQIQIKKEEVERKGRMIAAIINAVAVSVEFRENRKKYLELESIEKWNWLETNEGSQWLTMSGGHEWLRTTKGGEWLSTEIGQNWLKNQNMNEFIVPWFSKWMTFEKNWGWLMSKAGDDWLKSLEGQKWLRTDAGYKWLETEVGFKWIKHSPIGNCTDFFWLKWLTSSHNRDWLETKEGSLPYIANDVSETIALTLSASEKEGINLINIEGTKILVHLLMSVHLESCIQL